VRSARNPHTHGDGRPEVQFPPDSHLRRNVDPVSDEHAHAAASRECPFVVHEVAVDLREGIEKPLPVLEDSPPATMKGVRRRSVPPEGASTSTVTLPVSIRSRSVPGPIM
jgi:hypothetical protein